MKRYYRDLKVLIVPAVLLALGFAAWSDAGEGQEPNAPGRAHQTTSTAEGGEPNMPVQNSGLTIPIEGHETIGPEEGARPVGSSDSWDAFKIVLERNMFSRRRGPRVQRTSRQVPVAPPAPDPESYVVLKGIVQQDGEFIAFLEDTQSGQIRRVRQGDSVVRGKIKALTLDSIEYEFGDRTVTVTMGSNLQGGLGGATFTGMYDLTQTSSTPSAAGTTESSVPATEDEAEILKQLMERRQQQIGQ
ncbi:MAG: hypothetical protein ACYTBS_00255 [Planctomycetota bacterium]